MDNKVYVVYDSIFGNIVIESDGSAITSIKTESSIKPVGSLQADELTDKAAAQLDEYFAGKRSTFDVPLNPSGTDFQHRVWNALRDIPYGEIRSYKQIACAIDNPKACRAVGLANNKNPIWIMIPCHRVIGSNGSLIGYGGGLPMKEKLLKLENKERN